MNFTNNNRNINLEFSRVKLLGYYETPINSSRPEREFPEEAEILFDLLNNSFNSAVCIKSVDSEIRDILLNSEVILKNANGRLISFSAIDKIVKISDVIYNSKLIKRLEREYQCFFTPGDPFTPYSPKGEHTETKREITKVTATIKQIVNIEGYYYYELLYAGNTCYVKLLPFEVQILDNIKQRKTLDCVYLGLDEKGVPKLVQDRNSFIDDLYEEDTVQTFYYINSAHETHGDIIKEYHWVRDSYGLKHRLYAELSDEEKYSGNKLELYIKRIDPRTKKLSLTFYNPNLDRGVKEWYSAERIFSEINEIDNKEQYFDCYFSDEKTHRSKLEKDLVGQYSGNSNLWLFTYLNVLDIEFVGLCFRKHKIEELAVAAHIMIKLQEWMVEKSTFLDLFTSDTKDDIILKSTSQILKYQRILLAIDIVKKGEQYEYINNIVSSALMSGRIAINRDERIEVMMDILKIYPEFIIQDIESTSNLIKALIGLEEGIRQYHIDFIISLLNYFIEYNTRQIRRTTIRTNDIDTTRTLNIIEILTLLGLKILIFSSDKWFDELKNRESKARFFRFLSFLSADSIQSTILDAAINALVGILNDKDIFTWENITNINAINLCHLTANAAVLDCNLENDYYYNSGRSGVLSLDPTGFTIVPYKQCITSILSKTTSLEGVNIIHNLETLPLKLGSMYNYKSLVIQDGAVEQFLMWNAITRTPASLEKVSKPLPQIGDIVRIMVKEQTQPDKLKGLIFVTVIDNRFQSVEGVIPIKEISSKWIEDARTIFSPGDVLYASVCTIKNDKFNFSIKDEADKQASVSSSAADDARSLVINKTEDNVLKILPKGFIQELILLVAMRIRKEHNMQHKLTFIGYAYCLSALLGDPKSYYYEFLLRYYACIDKFITGRYQDVSIPVSVNANKYFQNISSKLHLVELLAMTDCSQEEGIASLTQLASQESNNDVGKLSSMLLTYIYAQKAIFSSKALSIIKSEINEFISNPEVLNLTALDDSTKEIPEEDSCDSEIDTDESISSENNFTVIKELQEVTNDEIQNEIDDKDSRKFSPFVLAIQEDSSIQVLEDKKSNSSEGVVKIQIKQYAEKGNLILVNNNAGISKVSVESLSTSKFEDKIPKCINPYKLSNHFVIASDCIVGTILITDNERFVELRNTKEIPTSPINEVHYSEPQCGRIVRHQAFILPEDNRIDGISEFYNQIVRCENIPHSIVKSLESYGIYI